MKTTFLFSIISLFFVICTLTGCGSSKTEKSGVSGTYNTDFGSLVLTQDGDKVTGNYEYKMEKENVKGTLKGTLNGQVLTFTWEQPQANQKSGGSGSFNFEKDFNSFTGSWSDTKGGTGVWNGKR